MKKCLLLCCILAAVNQVFAFTTQGHWRWRNDDGSQTTATYIANENTAPTITSYDNIRLRTEIYNPNNDAINISNTTLAYSTTGTDGSWILISDTTLSRDFALTTSSYVTALEPTTQQLSARAGYTFVPGVVITSQDIYTYSLSSKDVTEFEFVIKPTATAKLNTTYYFETSVVSYDTPLPTLTTGAVLPVTLISFTVAPQDNKAVVKWTTGNEVNNDHFDILRSADGQSWQTIATIKAKNNGSAARNNYEITDNTPLTGNSFYRLRQSDKDGKTTLSAVKPFSSLLKNILASVYPNPVVDAINIQLKDYTGAVTATLVNAQGIVVHKEIIAAGSATSSYKLNLHTKLSAGAYYITLSGTNLSQKIKVIVP